MAAELIPEEIVMKILLRLPARSLVRFRSVCKSWNALITKSHAFIASHLQLHKNKDRILIERHEKEFDSDGQRVPTAGMLPPQLCHVVRDDNERGQLYELSKQKNITLTRYFRNQLIDSCNGVICIQSDNEIFLCNPSINELVTLPPLNTETAGLVGFGHNPFSSYSNDFKVIHFYVKDLQTLDQPGRMQLEVYSTLRENNNNNSWRQMDSRVVPSRLCKPYLGKQVIYQEFICWCPFEDALLLLDVVKEEFSEIKLPNCLQFDNKKKHIALLDGCLSLITFDGSKYDDDIIKKSVQVWVMKEKKAAVWTKLYQTDLLGKCRPLGFVRGYCVAFRRSEGRLVFYNSRTGMLEWDRAPRHIGNGSEGCRDYKESLVSILLPKVVEDHYLIGAGDLLFIE